MTIEKAISRITWRLSQGRPNQQDQDALNTIIDFVNATHESGYMENLPFAKLFGSYFMFLAASGKYDAAGCVQKIEDILRRPLNEIIQEMALNVPFFKFERVLYEPTKYIDPFDFEKLRKARLGQLEHHKKELLKALTTRYTPEQASDFIKSQTYRLNKIYNQKEWA